MIVKVDTNATCTMQDLINVEVSQFIMAQNEANRGKKEMSELYQDRGWLIENMIIELFHVSRSELEEKVEETFNNRIKEV